MPPITWVGGLSNNFTDKQNWSPQQVPGASDDAIIEPASATTILVAGANTVNSLTTNANVALEVTSGSVSLSDNRGTGTSINAGTIVVEDKTQLRLAGTIDNSGTIATNGTYNGSTLLLESGTVTRTGTETLVNVSDTIEGAGSIENLSLFDNQDTANGSGANALVIGPGAGTVTNTGTFESSDTGGLTISGGTLTNLNAGTLAGGKVIGTGTVAAAVHNRGGGVAAGGGKLVLADAVSGAGALVATGTLEFAGAGNVIDGPLLGNGLLDFGPASSSTINRGVRGNIGKVEIDAGATVTMGLGAKYPGTMTVGGADIDGATELENSKTILLTGALTHGDGSAGTGSVVNSTGATYLIEGHVEISAATPATDVFHNSGLFEKIAGNFTSGIAADSVNAGTVEVGVPSGTLDFTGGFSNSGLTDVAHGAFATTGTITGGTLSVGADATAALFLAGTQETVQQLIMAASASVDLGIGTITVTGDCQNNDSGSGNSYNPGAGVGGTIDGKRATLTIVGVNGTSISNGNGTLTITLAPNGTNQDSGEFEIENTGAAGGATLRGALQTSVNGGHITNPGLSGNGVTAANFAPIAASRTSGIFTINYSTTNGAVSGQAIHIETDLANVPGIALAIATNPPAATTLFNQYASGMNGGGAEALSLTPPAPAPILAQPAREENPPDPGRTAQRPAPLLHHQMGHDQTDQTEGNANAR